MSRDTINRLENIILNGLLEKHRLESILSEAANELCLSIRIVSISSSVLLAYPEEEEEEEDEARDLFGDIPESEITEFFRRGEPQAGFGRNEEEILCPLSSEGHPFGMAVVRARGDVDTETLLAAAGRIAKLYTRFLHANVYLSPFSSLYNNFLANFLFFPGAADKSDTIAPSTRALLSAKQFRGAFLMIAFRDAGIRKTPMREADSALERYLPNAVHMVDHGYLYAFLSALPHKRLTREDHLVMQAEKFAQDYLLTGAMSEVFEALEDRAHYKRQIERLLQRIAGGENVLLAGEQYANIVYAENQRRLGTDCLLLHELRLLQNYDVEHNTSYLDTLRVYLQQVNRISAAAAKLFIDHSTMIYRLKKISDIIGSDPDDPALALRMRFSLAAYDFDFFR